MIDIRNMPDVLTAINTVLNNREIAEIKVEPKGVSVVGIHRTVKVIETIKKED
jgi:hypothetical protein